jgi:hypothetical protein
MRTIKFDFHPEQIRVTPEEILADLRYPAPAGSPRRRTPPPKHPHRRRGRA